MPTTPPTLPQRDAGSLGMSPRVYSAVWFNIRRLTAEGRDSGQIAAFLNVAFPTLDSTHAWRADRVRRFAKQNGLPVPALPNEKNIQTTTASVADSATTAHQEREPRMSLKELASLAATNPAAFVEAFKQSEEERKAKRRASYARNPAKYQAQNRRWADDNPDKVAERRRHYYATRKALKEIFKKLTAEPSTPQVTQ